MPELLPLGAAAARLRGKPGRPRKSVDPLAESAVVALGMPPRLLDLDAAANYLAVSPWTVRDLIAAGTLPRVRIPLPGGRDVRKVLLDRQDLDRCIATWRDA